MSGPNSGLALHGDGERGVLTNARCLTEGVDVPTLNGVAFIDPRRSQIDIVQAVGRAIRNSEDKTAGTIVIPVFVDEEADAEQALGSGEFNRVWEVVKALRAHDDLLADELDELRRELGRRNTSVGRPAKIHFDLPVGIGDAFIRAFDTKLVETATSTWEFWFGLLQCFVERNGHALVPHRRLEQGYRLGAWVANQRTAFREHRMANDRTARLQALPGWVWNTVDAAWEEGFCCLERYAAREGHARAPQGHVEDDYRLGSWVSDQCEAYHAGRLPEERIARLEALPGWAWNRIDAAWEEAYAILDRFAARRAMRVSGTMSRMGASLGRGSVRSVSASARACSRMSVLYVSRRSLAGSGTRATSYGKRATRPLSASPSAKAIPMFSRSTLSATSRSASG